MTQASDKANNAKNQNAQSIYITNKVDRFHKQILTKQFNCLILLDI